MSPELATFLTRLQTHGLSDQPDAGAVLSAYQDFVASCDLPLFVLGVMSTKPDGTPELSSMWSNVDRGWLDEYDACNYDSHDYVLLEARKLQQQHEMTLGLKWSRSTAERSDVTPQTRQVLRGAADAGLFSAVSFWGHAEKLGVDGGGRTFGFTLGAPEKTEEHVETLFRANHNALLIATFAMLPVLRPQIERARDGFAGRLTPREREVLAHFTQGLRPERIAERLDLSRVTVDLHATSARRKLGAQTMPEAVAKAIRFGLI